MSAGYLSKRRKAAPDAPDAALPVGARSNVTFNLLQARFIRIGRETLSCDGEGPTKVSIGLQPPRLRQAPGDEIFLFPVGDLTRETLGRTMVRVQLQDFLHGGFGCIGCRIDRLARLLKQRVHQHRADHGVSGIQLIGLAQGFDRAIGIILLALLPCAVEELQSLLRTLLILADQLFELQQFRLAGEIPSARSEWSLVARS